MATRTMADDSPGARVAQLLDASALFAGHLWGRFDRLKGDAVRDSAEVARQTALLYAAASGRATAVRTAWRATPRFTRILKEFIWVLARYRVHAGRAAVLGPEQAARELDALHAWAAARVRRLCAELGGGMLKLGQFLSCRMDLLPDVWISELSLLRDQAPELEWDVVAIAIEEELGAPPEELFEHIEHAPLAAASLAQVHVATLKTGAECVVKVQRPGVAECVEIDMAAFAVLAHVLRDHFPEVDLRTIATEVGRSVRSELDFTAEARHLREAAALLEDTAGVAIPVPDPTLSTSRVLTMSCIRGARLTEWLDGAAPDDRDALFGTMINAFCAQILGAGLFHSDPHPGNFLVVHTEGAPPVLAILDWGGVERLSKEARRAYADAAGAILSRDAERVARLLGDMGFETRDGDPRVLVDFAELFLEAFMDGGPIDFTTLDPQAQLERALALARENPVVTIPPSFVMLGRVFGALGGLVMHYQPRLDLLGILAPWLSRAHA